VVLSVAWGWSSGIVEGAQALEWCTLLGVARDHSGHRGMEQEGAGTGPAGPVSGTARPGRVNQSRPNPLHVHLHPGGNAFCRRWLSQP
jgi:hypothetical protein